MKTRQENVVLRLKRTLRTARRRGWVRPGGTKRGRDGRPMQRGYENQDCTCIMDLDVKGLHEEDLCPKIKALGIPQMVARPEQDRVQEVQDMDVNQHIQPETNTNCMNKKTHIIRKSQEDDQPQELRKSDAESSPRMQQSKMISLQAPPEAAPRFKPKRKPRVKPIKGVRDIREFLKGKVGGNQGQQGSLNLTHNELGVRPMEPGLGGQDGHGQGPQDPS